MSMAVSNGNLSGQAGLSALGTSRVTTGRKSSVAGAFRTTKSRSSSMRKKNLNYNPREISQQILRASKTIGASQVLVRARGKVGVLERCLATGQYEEREVRTALTHAKRMVKCARMKVNHLKEEEQQKKRNASTDQKRGQQKANEVKRRAATKKQELQRKAQLEMKKLEHAQQVKAREQALQKKRRMHRDKEREKIIDAEMKYLQGDTGNEMENQPISSYAYEGVIFEVSAQLMELAAQAQQLDDELEREIEQELAAADMAAGGIAQSGTADAGVSADASVETPADAVSIDISL